MKTKSNQFIHMGGKVDWA